MARNLVPQGSILGSLLYNIFICGLFYVLKCTDIANSIDDTATYHAKLTQKLAINKLEETSSIFFKWFKNNYLKVHSDKSHLFK